MKIELHILQNFPPHCLNRDDANMPKDCQFGGFRRARISSQCSKRAMRMYVMENQLLTPEKMAVRSKALLGKASEYLKANGRNETEAMAVVEAALGGIGLALKEEKTQYLLYLADEGIKRFVEVCNTNWDSLREVAVLPESGDTAKGGKQKKKEAKASLDKNLQNELMGLLDGKKAVDLALFGRMLADLPDRNVDAACQVAHAISTNEVRMEMDFYTAVDDLNTKEDTGAGMMGVIDFNSACFYRYLLIDYDKLLGNLENDSELAKKGLKAFLEAAINAIPTGKQNSMAAQNTPSYVCAIVRDKGQPWNLANAFVSPVRPGRGEGDDLVTKSFDRLKDQLTVLSDNYGENGKRYAGYVNLTISSIKKKYEKGQENKEPMELKANLDALINGVMETLP